MTTGFAPQETRAETHSFEFRAMGTDWYVEAIGVSAEQLAQASVLVEREEQRCSRFRDDSALSLLNRERSATDGGLALLVAQALALREATEGAFDPAVGDAVIAAGYRCDFDELIRTTVNAVDAGGRAQLEVVVEGQEVRLEGSGRLDLGGIAKGWTADLVGRYLSGVTASRWLVDAGGDIVVGGAEPEEQLIGVELTGLTIGLSAGAVATSSTHQRAWETPQGPKHHIIDPTRGAPTDHEYVLATVLANCAATADALATALLADPERATEMLARHQAEAILVTRSGDTFMSPAMAQQLR